MQIGPAVILIIVAAIAGYLIGIFDSRLTQAAQKKLEEASKPAAEAPKDQNVAGEHSVLKMTIDPAIKWHLELDGARLEDPNMISAEQRQRLVNVVVQMRPWIDGKPAPAAVSVPNSQHPAPEQSPLKPLTASAAAQMPVPSSPATPKIDALRGLRTLLKNEVKTPDQMKSVSIVAMIDDVLQAKLPGTQFSGKGIRLEEGSLGEVVVYVGASRYPGIDAVPDPEVQALIRSAIADWEKK